MNVAIIPARGGSKGIPGKNVKILAGKPLIVHSIEQCLAASMIDLVFVTTDDQNIASVSSDAGAHIIQRPVDISGDTASSESALIHALGQIRKEGFDPEVVFFLQCTSPVRPAGCLDRAYSQIIERQADSLLAVSPSHSFLWERGSDNKAIAINYDYMLRPRRQDMKPQYRENGSFYIFKPKIMDNCQNRLGGCIELFEMPEECAYEIDSETDFMIVEHMMKRLMCL